MGTQVCEIYILTKYQGCSNAKLGTEICSEHQFQSSEYYVEAVVYCKVSHKLLCHKR